MRIPGALALASLPLLAALPGGCRHEIASPPPGMAPTIVDLEASWVTLFEGTRFRGRSGTLRYPRTASDLSRPAEAAGGSGGDRLEGPVASVRWQVPEGWMAVLYEEANYRGRRFPLFGTGRAESNPDLGDFAGRTASIRWERREEGPGKS